MKLNPNRSQTPALFAALSVAAVSVVAVGTMLVFVKDPARQVSAVAATAVSTPTEFNPFTTLDLEARSAYVIDLVSGEALFQKNAELQLPLASLTKLMTALIVATNLSPTDIVTITQSSLNADGDTGLHIGETFIMNDLLAFALVTSSNDATVALAEAALSSHEGVALSLAELMNTQARELSLAQTYFVNETGLDPSLAVSGAYGSARDVATLLSYLVTTHASLVEPTREESVSISGQDGSTTRVHSAKNTNVILPYIPGLMASKTGFTDLAGGNLAIAFDIGLAHPVVAVVLGSSEEGRFVDMMKIVETTQRYLSAK